MQKILIKLSKDAKLLKKYIEISDKISYNIEKELDSEPMIYICYSVILTDSVFEIDKNNYPQIFL